MPDIVTNCRVCGTSFTPVGMQSARVQRGHAAACPACLVSEEHDIEQALALQAQRERTEKWEKLCPPLYRDCAPEKLPSAASRAALANALTYKPADGGLGIIGRESGQGKSRIAFAALKPHYMAGHGLKVILSGEFTIQCASNFDNQLEKWLAPYKAARALLIDDLGKGKPNERVNSAFFSLIEHRCAYLLPTIFTSNYDGEELESRFAEHGPYIVRRLREFSRIILL